MYLFNFFNTDPLWRKCSSENISTNTVAPKHLWIYFVYDLYPPFQVVISITAVDNLWDSFNFPFTQILAPDSFKVLYLEPRLHNDTTLGANSMTAWTQRKVQSGQLNALKSLWGFTNFCIPDEHFINFEIMLTIQEVTENVFSYDKG